jgi:hypothetical protein
MNIEQSIEALKKIIGGIILPKFPEIKSFIVKPYESDKMILVVFYINESNDEVELQIHEDLVSLKDYLSLGGYVLMTDFIVSVDF